MFKKTIYSYIKHMLATDQQWQRKALVAMYNRQTQQERNSEITIIHNEIGFTGADAELLTSFAKQLLSRGFLSFKQQALLSKKIPKYWGQIYDLSDKDKLLVRAQAWVDSQITNQTTIQVVEEWEGSEV
jgi:hypothetical protein